MACHRYKRWFPKWVHVLTRAENDDDEEDLEEKIAETLTELKEHLQVNMPEQRLRMKKLRKAMKMYSYEFDAFSKVTKEAADDADDHIGDVTGQLEQLTTTSDGDNSSSSDDDSPVRGARAVL